MTSYQVEDEYMAQCPHSLAWLIDDIPGPDMWVCAACGAVVQVVHIVTSSTSPTMYLRYTPEPPTP